MTGKRKPKTRHRCYWCDRMSNCKRGTLAGPARRRVWMCRDEMRCFTGESDDAR